MMFVQRAVSPIRYFSERMRLLRRPALQLPHCNHVPLRINDDTRAGLIATVRQSTEPLPAYLIVRSVVAPENESNDQPVTNMFPRHLPQYHLAISVLKGEDLKIVRPGLIAVRVVFDGDKGIES